MRPQRFGVGMPNEVLERRGERAVRRADDGIAVAVEHGRTLGGDFRRELAHEPTLARAGLPREKRSATPFPGGTG